MLDEVVGKGVVVLVDVVVEVTVVGDVDVDVDVDVLVVGVLAALVEAPQTRSVVEVGATISVNPDEQVVRLTQYRFVVGVGTSNWN